MQQRRGTAEQWTAANPVLAAGEIGFETDTSKFKMGNGSSAWSALSYFSNTAALEALLNDGAPEALNTLNELAAAIGDDPAFFTNIGNSIADNIDSHNVSMNVHGIANTTLLATLTNVSTAQTAAETFATGAVTTHNNTTNSVHGIADTTALATTANVTTAIGDAVTGHSSDTVDIHGISNTANLVYTSDLSGHNLETVNVHGIDDTADLATKTYADTAVSTHAALTLDVHGIVNTALLATQDYVDTAVGTAAVDQSALAGIGIEWNESTDQFDIDSTVATTTHVSTEIGAHNTETLNVHGIADTSLLATTADVAAVTKTTLGLGNVDNTSDADKPVSTATVTAIATAKSEAVAEVTAVIDGAPNALNTLNELAAALGDDANFASTVTTSLAAKVDSYTPITQKTESYTLSTLNHRDDLIEMGSASALTLTIPLNSSIAYPVGTSLDILQTGAGQVTIAGAAGVTVNATPGLKLRTQWSSATLFKRAENTWVVYGDLTA